MTTLILQRGKFDCTIASMAMFLDTSYESVVETAQRMLPQWDPSTPGSLSLIQAVCDRLGTPVVTSRYFVEGAPQILCVQDNGPTGFHHAVYWNGRHVFDPSPIDPMTEEWVRNHYFDSTIALWDFAPVVLEAVLRYQQPNIVDLRPR